VLDEYLIIVKKTDDELLEVQGCVSSLFAHQREIPHTTVQLIPVFKGTQDVLIHRRAANRWLYPNKLDFNGGHVTFEFGLMNGNGALLEVVENNALREAREEIWISEHGKPYIIPKADLFMFTQLGEMEVTQPNNVEYSTGFVVFLPSNLTPDDKSVQVVDDAPKGAVDIFASQRVPLSQVREDFRANPDDFADGASRILSRLDNNPKFEQALMDIII
jgi:hypothetical protein